MSRGASDGATTGAATLHSAVADSDTALGRLLRSADPRVPGNYPLVCGFTAPVMSVTATHELLSTAKADLGEGPAVAEATAVRLRRQAVTLTWGEPVPVADESEWLALCHARGADSVRVLRCQPDLLPELQIGAWWSASPRYRFARRRWLGRTAVPRGEVSALVVRSDRAFWAGVRAAASAAEWDRLVRSSYVVLCYHRVAGDARPGQQRMDISPRRFRRQLAVLRALRWQPLTPGEVVAFHDGTGPVIGRRRYVLTFDDGFLDAVVAATRAGRHRPQLFAVTGAVGGAGDWLGGEPLADWSALAELTRVGGVVGSHASRHVPLDTLAEADIATELTRSLSQLREQLPVDIPLLAYPHGAHDLRVRQAAIDAGYAIGYSSNHGRNGAGTDRWCLRRVEPKDFDRLPTFLWKVVTGSNRGPASPAAIRRRRAAQRSG